jgi:ankyrin repeat protein
MVSARAAAALTTIAACLLLPERPDAQRRGGTAPDPLVSPLTAAVWTGNSARVRTLLDAGADPATPDDAGAPPWVWAAVAGDTSSLAAMLERTTDIHADNRRTATTLPLAAVQNDRQLAGELLRRGVDVDFRAVDGSSALMLASASGFAEMAELLLDWGADASAQDQFGDNALMSAVRAGAAPVVRLLLQRGAAVGPHDAAQRTAMTWALRTGRDDLAAILRASGAASESRPVRARAAATARAAVVRTLPLLQTAAQSWLERQRCASCHHQPMIEQTTALARRHGFAVDESLVRAQRERSHGNDDARRVRLEEALRSEQGVLRQSLQNGGDPAFGNGWFDAADVAADAPRSPAATVEASLLARLQLPDGSWQPGPPRIPIQSSRFKTTANAVRVLAAFGPADQRAATTAQIDRGRNWLLTHTAVTADDLTFRLFGLRWAAAAEGDVARAADDLRRAQRADGGWAQIPGLNSDAYATGMALVALHEAAALTPAEPVYRRGVHYLIATQEADGSWLVHKRAYPMNPYFESGFPHGKFQFISYAGSCWATMALIYAADAK